jgi:hypothetical protein
MLILPGAGKASSYTGIASAFKNRLSSQIIFAWKLYHWTGTGYDL